MDQIRVGDKTIHIRDEEDLEDLEILAYGEMDKKVLKVDCKLSDLTYKDYRVAELFIQGYSKTQIAKKLHLSILKVSRILKDERLGAIIDEYYEKKVSRGMNALASIAVENLREGMRSGDEKTKFDYTKLYFQTQLQWQKKQEDDNHAEESAEDLIQRMIEIQININNEGSSGPDVKLVGEDHAKKEESGGRDPGASDGLGGETEDGDIREVN